MNTHTKNIPKLRFHKFSKEWQKKQIGDVLLRVSIPVKVDNLTFYRQIGIRSHGKGIFHKEAVTGATLGNKRVFWIKPDLFVLNIVFAWEQAIAKTTMNEKGMIASHRFPMYSPNEHYLLDYIFYFFLTKKGKNLLGLASPGGAGRNKTLGQKNFEELYIFIPKNEEQEEIVGFLAAIDEKIVALVKKVELLKKYKKGVMQKIFSQQIRFKDETGEEFSKWEKKKFGDIYEFLKTNSFSRAMLQDSGEIKNIHYGDIHTKLSSNFDSAKESIAYLSSKNDSDYCQPGDLIIADASEDRKDAGKSIEIIDTHGEKIVAGLHTFLARPHNGIEIGFSGYFMQCNQLRRQLWRIATGASVLGISKTELAKFLVTLPSKKEQQKIVDILTSIDAKIQLEERKLVQAKKFKKSLLQQMFV